MNKLLKALAGFIAPRFHAAASTAGAMPLGSVPGSAGHFLRPGVWQALMRVFVKPAASVQAHSDVQRGSLHDAQCRQADARMAQVMVETRMF